MRNKDQWLLIAILAGLLIMIFCYSVAVWQATPSMPLYANIVVGVATTLTLVAGCGLTAGVGDTTSLRAPKRKRMTKPTQCDAPTSTKLREAVTLPAPDTCRGAIGLALTRRTDDGLRHQSAVHQRKNLRRQDRSRRHRFHVSRSPMVRPQAPFRALR
jgi:hypothetical protein